MIRKARAVWRGSGRDGNGDLRPTLACLQTRRIHSEPDSRARKAPTLRSYSPPHTRGASRWPWPFDCSARVHPYGAQYRGSHHPRTGQGGFRVSLSALTLRASVPNLDQDTFARLARDAEQNCPVSRVLRAEITLDAKLV